MQARVVVMDVGRVVSGVMKGDEGKGAGPFRSGDPHCDVCALSS